MPNFHIRLLLAFAFVLAVAGKTSAQSEVPIERALEVIESLAGKHTSVRWNIRYEEGTLTPDGRFEPSPVTGIAKCVYEPTSGRFRVDTAMVHRWSGGTHPFLTMRSQWAFDGSRLSKIERQRGGQHAVTLSKDDFVGGGVPPSEGTVWGDIDMFLREGTVTSGFYCFPPYFMGMPLHERLRNVLSKGRPVNVVDRGDSVWRIRIEDWNSDKAYMVVDLDFDLGKGGLVTKAEWKNTNSVKGPWRVMKMTPEKRGNNWAPKEIRITSLLDKPQLEERTHYTDIRFDEPTNPEMFSLVFPNGARVVDYVEKKAYTVGATPQDEQELIKAFMQHHGLTAPPPATTSWKQVLLISLAGIALCAVSVLFMRRWRRHAQTLTVLAVVLGINAFGIARDLPPETDRKKEDAKPHLTQCGFQVSVFALNYFCVESNAAALSKALEPKGFEGISMANVQKVLQDNGLRAEARQGVNLSELKMVLRDGWVAILPVQGMPSCYDYDFGGNASTWDHYVVAVHHAERGPLLVDVLNSIRPLDQSKLSDSHLQDPKRAVLFIRRK